MNWLTEDSLHFSKFSDYSNSNLKYNWLGEYSFINALYKPKICILWISSNSAPCIGENL